MTPQPGSFPPRPTDFPGPYQYTGELPLGLWNMFANGRVFELKILGVQGHQVDANMSSGTIQDAEWEDTAGPSTLAKLSFTRVLDNIGLKQRFTGYLMHYDRADPLWRLVGTFGRIEAGDQAGWYATMPK